VRLLALCVCVLSVLLAAPSPGQSLLRREKIVFGLGAAYLQDPVTGNLLTIQAPGTSIRLNSDGTWSASATLNTSVVEIIRPGYTAPDLRGFGRVVISGEFEPDDPAHPAAGGRWDLEHLNIDLRAALTDTSGGAWAYDAHIAARNANFTRFSSTLVPQ
jgi:hypothetical protein